MGKQGLINDFPGSVVARMVILELVLIPGLLHWNVSSGYAPLFVPLDDTPANLVLGLLLCFIPMHVFYRVFTPFEIPKHTSLRADYNPSQCQ